MSAVVGESQRRLVRHPVGRNRVAAPQLRGIDLQLVGGDVDQPLDHITRLRPPGAAIRRRAVGVGQHARNRDVQRRCRIGADDRADIDNGRHGTAKRHEGAEVAVAADAHAEKLAVSVERECRIDDVFARVIVADMRLVAGLRPFHGPADPARRPQHQDDFGVHRTAQAIGAADIAGDQPQFGLRDVERRAGDIVAEQPRPLEAAMQRVAARARVVHADCAARFDRIGGDAIDDEALLDDVCCTGERRIGLGLVACLIEVGFVARTIVIKLRRLFLRGGARRYDCGTRRILDDDALSRVTRSFERVGHGDRHRIADMHDTADRDWRTRR